MAKTLSKAAAEFAGTALLVCVVVGSGIMGSNLSPDSGVALLINAFSTIFALALLILLLGPISGAHFNPVVSLVQLFSRNQKPLEVFFYIVAQVAGAITGAVLANVMFDLSAVQVSGHDRVSLGTLVGEVLATAGLIAVIGILSNRDQAKLIPVAVAAWIGSAYFFTSSTSFANPAVTIGRVFSDTFAGIAPASVLPYIAAQLIGAALGVLVVKGCRMPNNHPAVLFVCVHNAGKSQMAAALMRAKAGDSITVLSGGTHPGGSLNAEAKTAAQELGASMEGEHPKEIADEVFMNFDRIVILGNEAKLTAIDGMRGTIETWLTPEPGPEVGDKLAQTRIVRDDIARRIDDLYNELTEN